MKEKRKLTGEQYALIAFFSFTAANLFDKFGLSSGINAFAALIFKDFIIWIVAVVICFRKKLFARYYNKKSPEYVGWKGIWPWLLSGPIMDVIGTAFFYIAISVGSLVIAVPCIQSQTMWAALIASVMLHEKLNKKTVMGILVFIAGLLLVNCGSYFSGQPIEATGNSLLCAVIALIAGFAWAFSTVLWKKGMQYVDKWAGLAIHYPTGWLVAFIYLATSGNLAAYHAPVNGIFALAASGVIGDLIAVPTFLTAMSLTTVNKANVIKSAYPILLSVLAWLIFKEYMNIWMFIGIVITVIGVVIVNRVQEGEEKTAYAK